MNDFVQGQVVVLKSDKSIKNCMANMLRLIFGRIACLNMKNVIEA